VTVHAEWQERKAQTSGERQSELIVQPCATSPGAAVSDLQPAMMQTQARTTRRLRPLKARKRP